MIDPTLVGALLGEHLPADRAASVDEFASSFRLVFREAMRGQRGVALAVRVAASVDPAGGVHHHLLLREAESGHLVCFLDALVEVDVLPSELDSHARSVEVVLEEGVNLQP